MIGRVEFRTGDARDLRELADRSVNLVVTSPPFLDRDARRYGGEEAAQLNFAADRAAYVDRLVEATREMLRVLKDDGSAFIHVGDGDQLNEPMHLLPHHFAVAVEARLKPYFGAPVIWQWGWDFRTNRLLKAWDVWFHLARSEAYFSNESEHGSAVWFLPKEELDPRVRALGGKDDHYAIEVANRLILMFSRPGDLVLDPFGGTGTTALAAASLGRHAISNDISAVQTRAAQARFDLFLRARETGSG